MSDFPLVYKIHVAGYSFNIREIEGSEELSKTWRLNAHFVLDPKFVIGDIDLFDTSLVLRETATITMEREGVVRTITGIVTEAELEASISGHPEVELTLEPRMSLLKHRRDVRIHRNLDVPQIVTEVAEALGCKVDNRLEGAYPNRPYCVQWRESDYDYCMRLLEDEGIFYFFTADDRIVLGDSPAAYDDLPGGALLEFRHAAGANQNVDAIHDIGAEATMIPGQITLRDWNTEHPSLDMDVRHGTDVDFGPEWYDYPGEYEEPTEGARKAQLHAEAQNCQARKVQGGSTVGRLYPGAVFEVPNPPFGVAPGRYALRRVDHAWNLLEEGYVNRFEAQPADITYRPPRDTYVPRIFNPHTGIVCTNGEDIQCDHFGRVKIHFHWDRLRPYDDDCSHWIPSMQDNTGGSSAIPRKDWEMVVHYLEGDPDRPIIIGRVFNGDDVFQEKLPGGKDRSALMSQTSPDRKSANEIRFDDAKGMERIFMRAPKDMNINVANNQTQTVGNNNTWRVENDETVDIGGDAEWTTGGALQCGVENDQTWTVTGNRKKTIGASDTNAVAGNHTLKIGTDHEYEVAMEMNTIADNLTETITGDVKEKYKMKMSVEIGGDLTLDIGKDYVQKVKHDKTESIISDRTETVKGKHTIKVQVGECQMRCDEDKLTTVKQNVKASCKEIMTLTGATKMETQVKKKQTWSGDVDLMLIVKDIDDAGGKGTYITMKGGAIEMYAKDKITFEIDGSAKHDSGKAALN